MGFILSIIRKIIYAAFALFLLGLLFVIYSILSQLPLKHSIPSTDAVWTSPAYVAQFPDAKVEFPFVESFVYESLLKWEDVKPELVLWARPQARQEEDKWDGEEEFMGDDGVGLVERLMGLFLEQEKIKFGDMLLGLLWNERNAGRNDPAGPGPSLPCPTISSASNHPDIKATVIAHEPNSMMAFSIAMRAHPNGEAHGFEVINIDMMQEGVKISDRYIWHRRLKPRWWKMQWFAIYVQLCGRLMWISNVFRVVGRLPVPIEKVDFVVNATARGEL